MFITTVSDIDFPDTELSQADIESLTDVLDNKNISNVDSRFREPVALYYVNKVTDSRFPTKTVTNTTWAVSLFGEWRGCQNICCLSRDSNCDVYIDKPLSVMSESELNYTLPLFLCEVRKKDGSGHPPESLRQLVASLQKHMEIQGRNVKFISDVKHKNVQDTLDGLMKQRAKLGMGLEKRQALVITVAMEDILWCKRLLGDHDPSTLLHLVLYLLGLHLALRGRAEHCRLRHRPSQITVKTDENNVRYLEYRKDVSKTFGGGLHSGKQLQKVTRAYELIDCPVRCPVRIYELYNSLCPPNRPDDAFYLRPLTKITSTTWYSCAPLGPNTLGNVVAELASAVDFKGFFSNHSLRATAATRLFDADVDEQLKMAKTGHTSTAVGSCKRISDEKLSTVSNIVAGSSGS